MFGDDFFFVIPTNKVTVGDIILIKGRPQCVIEADDKTIKVMNYEDMTIDTIVPERHVFMGNTYFYGKIVSMFGSSASKGKDGMAQMMKFMMMNQIMGGNTTGTNNMLPMMLMMNGGAGSMFDDMLDGMFDFAAEPSVADVTESDEEEDE